MNIEVIRKSYCPTVDYRGGMVWLVIGDTVRITVTDKFLSEPNLHLISKLANELGLSEVDIKNKIF